MGVVEGVVGFLTGVWHPVDFTVDELMDSTFMERLYAGGWWIGLSSVLIIFGG